MKQKHRFFKNQPRNDLSERRQKAGFLGPISSKITLTTKKNRKKEKARWKKAGKRKKAMVTLFVFIMATLDIVVGRKRLLDGKGPIAGNVFKNTQVS